MLYGQIKSSSFFDDHQNAIFGALKGIGTGGIIGASRDLGQHRTLATRLKKIRDGAIIGALAGTGFGHTLDKNKDNIRNFIDARVDYINTLISPKDEG